MISQREVMRRFKIAEPLEKPSVNIYRCLNSQCNHIIKTIEKIKGTTPMRIDCEKCNSTMLSSFYNDDLPEMKPTHEWYQPDLKKIMKTRKKPDLLEHYLLGGLEIRIIQ